MRLNSTLVFKEKFEVIRKECSKICDMCIKTGNLLYRGAEHIYPNFTKVVPRTDRTPLTSPKRLHDKLDNEFKDLFGWKPRSEGVFVSGSQDTAEGYGKVFITFPKDGFYYLWSNKIEDLYNDLDAPYYMIDTSLAKIRFGAEHVENLKKKSDQKIAKTILSYQTDNLEKAIKSGHEIMMKCDYYYVIRDEHRMYVYNELGM